MFERPSLLQIPSYSIIPKDDKFVYQVSPRYGMVNNLLQKENYQYIWLVHLAETLDFIPTILLSPWFRFFTEKVFFHDIIYYHQLFLCYQFMSQLLDEIKLVSEYFMVLYTVGVIVGPLDRV